jgi:hypothetical protein
MPRLRALSRKFCTSIENPVWTPRYAMRIAFSRTVCRPLCFNIRRMLRFLWSRYFSLCVLKMIRQKENIIQNKSRPTCTEYAIHISDKCVKYPRSFRTKAYRLSFIILHSPQKLENLIAINLGIFFFNPIRLVIRETRMCLNSFYKRLYIKLHGSTWSKSNDEQRTAFIYLQCTYVIINTAQDTVLRS